MVWFERAELPVSSKKRGVDIVDKKEEVRSEVDVEAVRSGDAS